MTEWREMQKVRKVEFSEFKFNFNEIKVSMIASTNFCLFIPLHKSYSFTPYWLVVIQAPSAFTLCPEVCGPLL